jgi:hypothetical protein
MPCKLTLVRQPSPSNRQRQDIKYHGFFIEGACYVLAFDLLQEKNAENPNLPSIRLGLKCLRSMAPKTQAPASGQIPITLAAIEQMVRSMIPNFELPSQPREDTEAPGSQQALQTPTLDVQNNVPLGGVGENPTYMYPTMPFGFDLNNQVSGGSSVGISPEEQIDFTAADMGWDIDFGTMNMDTWLSFDPSQNYNFIP